LGAHHGDGASVGLSTNAVASAPRGLQVCAKLPHRLLLAPEREWACRAHQAPAGVCEVEDLEVRLDRAGLRDRGQRRGDERAHRDTTSAAMPATMGERPRICRSPIRVAALTSSEAVGATGNAATAASRSSTSSPWKMTLMARERRGFA